MKRLALITLASISLAASAYGQEANPALRRLSEFHNARPQPDHPLFTGRSASAAEREFTNRLIGPKWSVLERYD